MRLQIISRAAGCQGAARSREQIQMGGGGCSKGGTTLKRLCLQRVRITGSRSRQSPGPTEPSQGCSSRTSRRAPEGPSNASSLSWSFMTTALPGILSPEPPPSAALSPPIHCPGTEAPLLTYSGGAVPFPLLHPPFQTEVWGKRNHMRKV